MKSLHDQVPTTDLVYIIRYPQKIQHFPGVTVYTPSNILNQSHVVIMFQVQIKMVMFQLKKFVIIIIVVLFITDLVFNFQNGDDGFKLK